MAEDDTGEVEHPFHEEEDDNEEETQLTVSVLACERNSHCRKGSVGADAILLGGVKVKSGCKVEISVSHSRCGSGETVGQVSVPSS